MEFTVKVIAVGDGEHTEHCIPERQGQPWKEGEDARLTHELDLAFSLLATAHGRSREAIIIRARHLIFS